MHPGRMVANPLTAQIAPAAVESFAGSSGRRPAGPLFDSLMPTDAHGDAGVAADPVMDSVRKGQTASPAVFPWMLPLNAVPPAAPGPAAPAEDAALATVAIAAGGAPPPVARQAGPAAAVPASP